MLLTVIMVVTMIPVSVSADVVGGFVTDGSNATTSNGSMQDLKVFHTQYEDGQIASFTVAMDWNYYTVQSEGYLVLWDQKLAEDTRPNSDNGINRDYAAYTKDGTYVSQPDQFLTIDDVASYYANQNISFLAYSKDSVHLDDTVNDYATLTLEIPKDTMKTPGKYYLYLWSKHQIYHINFSDHEKVLFYPDNLIAEITVLDNGGVYYQLLDYQWYRGRIDARTFVEVIDTQGINPTVRTVTAGVYEGVGGTVTGGGDNFRFGDEVTLTAIPAKGYYLHKWIVNGVEDSGIPDGLTRTVTVDSEDKVVVAWFKPYSFFVSFKGSPSANGSVSGKEGDFKLDSGWMEGEFIYGYETFVTAVPNDGYTVEWWASSNDQLSEDDKLVSTEAEYHFTINDELPFGGDLVKSIYLFAVFKPVQYVINVEASDDTHGTVSGSGTYSRGETALLTATPKDGYMFEKWVDKNGVVVSTQASYSYPVTGDITLTAVFAEKNT